MKLSFPIYLATCLICLSLSCNLLKPQRDDPNPSLSTTTDFDYWIHSPLHPANRQGVTFKVKAKDKVGIRKVELHIFEFELYTNENNLPSKRKRPGGEWGLIKTWDFDFGQEELSLEYFYREGFRAGTNVEYIFKVINDNYESTDKLALFDAGDSPWGNDKITLYATTRDPLRSTINVCFLSDEDYQNDWQGFLKDAEHMIYQGYHENNMIKAKKDKWNFYYTRQKASGRRIIEDPFNKNNYPQFMSGNTIPGIDAFGLLHRQPYSDGAYLKANFSFLAYNLFTSEGYNIGTAVHETAHAVFNLSDEYNSCVCFESPEGSNVFSTRSACEAFNRENGFPPGECSVIRHTNGSDWYMSEKSMHFPTRSACETFNRENGFPQDHYDILREVDGRRWFRALGGLCIMQDDGDNIIRPFQRTCSNLIRNFYQKLEIYDEPLAALAENENMFGYEAVVLLELGTEKNDLDLEVKQLAYGVPTKDILHKNYLDLTVKDQQGKSTYALSINNPDGFRIHAEKGDDFIKKGSGACQIAIPYQENLEDVVCDLKKNYSEEWTTKGDKQEVSKIKKVFNIGKICKANASKFSKQAQKKRRE